MGLGRKADVIDGSYWDPSTDGVDYIFGRGGNDKLFGLGGNDFIFGGRGKDKLYGGKGDDVCIGGKQADTYIFRTGDGDDKFRVVGKDKVNLAGVVGVNSFADLDMTQTAGGVLIDLPGDDSVLLVKSKVGSFDNGDFIL